MALVSILIFTNPRKGPKWWIKIAQPIFFVITLAVFLIIPFISISYTIAVILLPMYSVKDDMYFSFCLAYGAMSFCLVITYLTSIHKKVK